MAGNYVAIDSDTLQEIIDNELDLLEIDPNEYPTLDIDKAWEAIHFLLCGVSFDGNPPFGYVVPMREENALDTEFDNGAFAITHQQVQEAYNCIKDIGEQELRAKFNIKSFVENEIYPGVVDDDENSFFEYFNEKFKLIQDFYKKAFENNSGIVFYVM